MVKDVLNINRGDIIFNPLEGEMITCIPLALPYF